MHRRLPSLHLLRVFETAGRHMSFKRAAEELHVTPSTVSHEIKKLENQLGFPLFMRMNRSLALTGAGKAYLQVLEELFTNLRIGTDKVIESYGKSALKIGATASLSARVVVPKLQSLRRRLSDVELHVETNTELDDLRQRNIDFIVALAQTKRPGVAEEKLLTNIVSPVCSPAFVEEHGPLTIEALNRLPLVRMRSTDEAWPQWAHKAQVTDFDPQNELTFDSYDACMVAAERGLGLAMATLPLEKDAIRSIRLVKPFNIDLFMPGDLSLFYRTADVNREHLHIIHQWLVEQLH